MKERVSAIILSGGEGRRFGGQDKGLVIWHEKPLIEHVIQCLQAQVSQILISCNRNLSTYSALGFDTVQDQNQESLGPLAGVQASIDRITHPWCLICPCDMPQLPKNLVTRLLREAKRTSSDITYPTCGERHHYLPVLIRSEILPTVNEYLEHGGRSLKGWYHPFSVNTVDFSLQASCFSNINTPSMLTELRQARKN